MPHRVIRLADIEETCVRTLLPQATNLDKLSEGEELLCAASAGSKSPLLGFNHPCCLAPVGHPHLEESGVHLRDNGEEGDGSMVRGVSLVSLLRDWHHHASHPTSSARCRYRRRIGKGGIRLAPWRPLHVSPPHPPRRHS